MTLYYVHIFLTTKYLKTKKDFILIIVIREQNNIFQLNSIFLILKNVLKHEYF